MENDTARFAFSPDAGEVTRVTLRWGALSAFTFGLGRFWFKTAQRRLFWGRTTLGGDPFEYDGTAGEMLRGSVMVVILLGLAILGFNLALSWLSLRLFGAVSPPAAVGLTALAVLPVLEFAKYRARRYRLLRTRWRGVRFGMERGAGGFVLLWARHALLMVLTLGLSRPWLRMARERRMTERMRYGDAPFRFEGRAAPLFRPWAMVWFGALAAFAFLALIRNFGFVVAWGETRLDMMRVLYPLAAALAAALLYALWCGYRAAELNAFMEARRVAGLRITCRLDGAALRRAAWATVGRGLLALPFLALFLVSLAATALNLAVMAEGGDAAEVPLSLDLSLFARFETLAGQALFLVAAWANYGFAVLYLIWLVHGVHAPRAHAALMAAAEATGLASLAAVRNRPGEGQIEAEGFADVLDAGGL
ncbi:MAG: DUF898 family protein [Pikeienuella sp.]|uniref:DUF898 family protein n=1 Tax=Pikeienuella sp. TaxID=2831957 RepID=UPI00391A9932